MNVLRGSRVFSLVFVVGVTSLLAWTVYAAVSSDYPENGEIWLTYANSTTDDTESLGYYANIGAPNTLSEWQTAYGFPISQTEALFFSEDLGFARHARCREDGDLFACYVSYYDGATEEEALDKAIAGTDNLFFTAIVYSGTAASNNIQFYGYDNSGNLTTTIPFDSEGGKYVPHSCTSCHGGRVSANNVDNARLIPFSLRNMGFSAHVGYTRADQEEVMRSYNSFISNTSLKSVSSDFISGSYPGGVHNPGSTFDDNYIPTSWDTGELSRTLYTEIAQPYCQACHGQIYTGVMNDPAEIRSASYAILGDYYMPHAEALYKDFWDDPDAIWMIRELGWSYEVTRADDPMPDGCLAHDCSLREALIAANTDAYEKAITFTDTHQVFTLNGQLNFNNTNDQLLILGNGVTNTIINGSAYMEPINFAANTTHVTRDIAICGSSPWTAATEDELNEALACFNQETSGSHTLTVTAHISLTEATAEINNSSSAELNIVGQGYTLDADSGRRHFLLTDGFVSIDNWTLTNGQATRGGSIRNQNGTFTATNSIFSNNQSSGDGAVIYNNQNNVLVIDGTLFTGNVASGDGGAIYDAEGEVTIRNSTFTANSAQVGGAISGDGDPTAAWMVLENSTLSGNTSTSGEGAIETSGVTTITHSTIFSNTGGGIYRDLGFIYLRNTIVADNVNGSNCDYGGGVVENSNNLSYGDSSCTGFTFTSVDPLLGPLQDNGGGTMTHALLTGSPAIDAGAALLASTDQRGVARPMGAGADIGAFEWFTASISISLTSGTVSVDYETGSIYSLYRSTSPYSGYTAIDSTGMHGEAADTMNAVYWQTQTADGTAVDTVGTFPFGLEVGE